MRWTLLALVALLVGCTQPVMHRSFAFEGPPEDFEAVADAVDEWNACGVVHVDVTYGRSGGDQFPIVFSDADHVPGEGPHVIGQTYLDRIVYVHGEDVRAVVGHEIGHAMSLDHGPDGNLMEPVIHADTHPHVTSEDCEALRRR